MQKLCFYRLAGEAGRKFCVFFDGENTHYSKFTHFCSQNSSKKHQNGPYSLKQWKTPPIYNGCFGQEGGFPIEFRVIATVLKRDFFKRFVRRIENGWPSYTCYF